MSVIEVVRRSDLETAARDTGCSFLSCLDNRAGYAMLSAGCGEMHVEVISSGDRWKRVVGMGGILSMMVGAMVLILSKPLTACLGPEVSQPLGRWLERFQAVFSPHTIVIHAWEFWMPSYH